MGIHLQNAAKRIFRSTKLNHSYIEAISNSIDSIKERGLHETFTPQIDIILNKENDIIKSIKIIDNGIGFNDKNMDSFNTIFSDNKSVYGGKGCGHLSWIVEAERAEINSIYKDENNHSCKRVIQFDQNYFQSDEKDITTQLSNHIDMKTEVHIININDTRKIKNETIINNIISTFIIDFIEGNIIFNIYSDNQLTSINEYFAENIYNFTEDDTITAQIENKDVRGQVNAKIIRVSEKLIKESNIVLSAHNRKVLELNLNKYVPFLPTLFSNENSNRYCIIVWLYADILDERVNESRVGFNNIGDRVAGTIEDYDPIFITYHELLYNIKDELKELFYNDIEQLNIQKESLISDIIREEPSLHYIARNQDILSQLTEEDMKSQEKLIEKLTSLYRKEKTSLNKVIKNARELYKDQNNYEQFFAVLKDKISIITNIASHELSQYVSYRKVIIELLKDYTLYNIDKNNIENEDVFHQIIFPMRQEDSRINQKIDYYQHNLWLVDERLSYYYAIASDKQFSKIEFIDNTSNRRADLFVALTNNKEDISSFVLVEFKKPKRDDYTSSDNPIEQILDYVDIIRSGKCNIKKYKHGNYYNDPITLDSNIPIYAYIIADITPSLEKISDRRQLNVFKGQSGMKYIYGIIENTYITIKSYDSLLKDAQLNNKAFFDMLGI